MLQFMRKLSFFSVLFLACLFSAFSFAQSKTISERNKQLCYIKNNYIHDSYNYNYPYFYPKGNFLSAQVSSIIPLNQALFAKNPWELRGVQVNVLPFTRKQSITHWLKYDSNKSDNSLNKLCKLTNGICFFRVVYEGELHPSTNEFGSSAIKYIYKNKSLRVSIRDGKNNMLKLPKTCPE